uniref:4Fe-4S ferredoxin-type domain-containing protein n=1 Tax=Aureoumbra lagunensis TaxID=44058 RepID=A0A7S3NHS2_9STRA|mmetsp:Transcript_22148/g.27511  ORF Transcript_22148/g.27511 Transcript_22148/m.27511 type:complete len:1276 (+) Transcript_22148:91-3918(+)
MSLTLGILNEVLVKEGVKKVVATQVLPAAGNFLINKRWFSTKKKTFSTQPQVTITKPSNFERLPVTGSAPLQQFARPRTVNVLLNGKRVALQEGRLYPALVAAGIELPAICWHPDILNSGGRCRVCAVKINGKVATSCTNFVRELMEIETDTADLRELRDTAMAVDPKYRTESGLATAVGELDKVRTSITSSKDGTVHPRTPYVIRQPELCNHCNLCVEMCKSVQGVGAIGEIREIGDESSLSATEVKAFHGAPLPTTECVNCGQCINVCPTGALREASCVDEVNEVMKDPSVPKVFQFAPSVRVALAEEFGKAPGEMSLTKQMVAATRMMGDNIYVFDTNFTADLTIIEEGNELLERLRRVLTGKKMLGPDHMETALPMITSCSPGWVTYCEKNYADLIPNVSSCKSPQQMAGSLIKHFWSKRHGYEPANVISISVMPCVAKKQEASREEFIDANGVREVDYVLTTREFAELMKLNGVDPTKTDPSIPLGDSHWGLTLGDFDDPFGQASGAGLIFGATGGVMEAALRTAYEVVTGRPVPFARLDIQPVRGMDGVKVASVPLRDVLPEWGFLEGVDVKVAVAHGLTNARKLCDEIQLAKEKNEPPPYHFVEVMCCPGGCLGGGGQPKPTSTEIKMKRASLIYAEDHGLPLRKSHENASVRRLYDEFLVQPLAHHSHELLHTHYKAKDTEPRTFAFSHNDQVQDVLHLLVQNGYPRDTRALLTNMFSDIVDKYGYVSDSAIVAIADHVGASPVNIESILSHYHFFPRSPNTPKTSIYLCESHHCRQHGMSEIKQHLKDRGIPYHMTSWLGWSVDGGPAALIKHVGDSRVHHMLNITKNDPRLDDLEHFVNPLPEPNFNVLTMRRYSERAPSVLDDIVLSEEDEQIAKMGLCPVSQKAFAMDPDELIDHLDCASLRGCGGAGFPTHLKWRSVRDASAENKCVVVNADEGLPSTFKDYYLTRDASCRMRMLVGVATACHVVGAKQAYVYLRYEYKNLKSLIEADWEMYRTKMNPLAKNIPLTVVLGGGPYICGEETALFESLEGNLPQARTKRHQFPTDSGLFGWPTLVSNVETFAWIPSIIYHGGVWFHDLAVLPELGGAKLISISGDVAKPTLAAIPMGVTLRSVLEETAGIPIDEIAACEVGGLTEELTYPQDFDQPLTLAFKAGHLSAGGSIVVFSKKNFDEKRIFRTKAKFYDVESCQLCSPCREGAKVFRYGVDSIMDENTTLSADTIETYQHLFHSMEVLSNCGHGKACGKTARTILEKKNKVQDPENFCK